MEMSGAAGRRAWGAIKEHMAACCRSRGLETLAGSCLVGAPLEREKMQVVRVRLRG